MPSSNDSPACQVEALNGMNRILPFHHGCDALPEYGMFYEIMYDAETDLRLGHLLASPSDEVLTLALSVYEKIPWGTDYFTGSKFPDVDVVETLLRRLMTPDCQVFATAAHALGLFIDTQILPEGINNVILESGILGSEAFGNILDLASSFDPQIQESVASILSRVGYIHKSGDDVKACINAGVAQAFRRLLTSWDRDVRFSAICALREFTVKDDDGEFSKAFLSADLLSTLVPLQVAKPALASISILEILMQAPASSPLEEYIKPNIMAAIVRLLPTRHRLRAEITVRSLVRRYEHVPNALVVTTFINPIIDLLSSSNDRIRGGAARAIWLIAKHDNPYFAKAFLTAGVARPLATLLSSSNELVLKTALSAIRTVLKAEGATTAFRDAGVKEILAPFIRNSIVSMAQATILAIDPHHETGLDDDQQMELSWIPSLENYLSVSAYYMYACINAKELTHDGTLLLICRWRGHNVVSQSYQVPIC